MFKPVNRKKRAARFYVCNSLIFVHIAQWLEHLTTITLGGTNIKRVQETKPLGIIVDVLWKNQTSNIVAKVSKSTGMLLDKLQIMQNMAASVITGRSYEINSSDVLKELRWKPLEDRRKQNKAIFMHLVRNNNLPESMTSMFKLSNNMNYNLSGNEVNFDVQKPHTNFMKKSISYSGAILWNIYQKMQISIGQFRAILNSNTCT